MQRIYTRNTVGYSGISKVDKNVVGRVQITNVASIHFYSKHL